jgi:glutaconate CoA-transferase, subunit B
MSDATLDEIMAVVMARQVRDGDFVAHGASVPLAAAALMLAKELHAPNVDFFYQGTITTAERDPAKLMLDIEGIYRSAPAFFGQAQIVDFELRGGCDFQFLRPAQVDRFGNVNTSLVGTLKRPKYRFHGIAVADAMTIVDRVCLYVTEHTPRVFAAELSFVTGLGHAGEDAWRRALGVPGGGPCVVVSPLAVLDFGGGGGAMRLRELMPGVTVADVVGNTGFELLQADEVREVLEPTPDELSTLRRLDPMATRRLEFREWREETRARLAAGLSPAADAPG